MKDPNDERRFVLVTGAGKGIGRAAVLSLVRDHGCRVLAVSRDEAALKKLAEDVQVPRGAVETVALDITGEGAPERIRDLVGGQRLHALINNAGLLIKRPFGEWSDEDMQRLFRTNVFAPLRLVQALTPALRGTPPGHVVNVGSMGGFQGSVRFPGLAAYSASKAALANLTECIAEELKDSEVRCNCLCIGAVDTEMLRQAFPDHTAQVDPERMGSYVARFALEAHNIFNGKVLPVSLSTP